MAFNPDLYYPHRQGGPPQRILAVPTVRHDNFDTPRVIEDRVRNVTEYQGINEQEIQGYIQVEIDYAQTNRIGLKADRTNQTINRAADTYDGH